MDDEMLDRLDEMGAEVDSTIQRLMGDEEMYVHYLRELKNTESILTLRSAVERKDYAEAEKAAHTLKGIALNLGLLPLADMSMDMLMAFREGDNQAGAAMLGRMEAEFQRWVEAIEQD